MALNPTYQKLALQKAGQTNIDRDKQLGGLYDRWNNTVDESVKAARALDLDPQRARELYMQADDIKGDQAGLKLNEAIKFVDLVFDEFRRVAAKKANDPNASSKPAEAKTDAVSALTTQSAPAMATPTLNAPSLENKDIGALLSAYGMAQPASTPPASQATDAQTDFATKYAQDLDPVQMQIANFARKPEKIIEQSQTVISSLLSQNNDIGQGAAPTPSTTQIPAPALTPDIRTTDAPQQAPALKVTPREPTALEKLATASRQAASSLHELIATPARPEWIGYA